MYKKKQRNKKDRTKEWQEYLLYPYLVLSIVIMIKASADSSHSIDHISNIIRVNLN